MLPLSGEHPPCPIPPISMDVEGSEEEVPGAVPSCDVPSMDCGADVAPVGVEEDIHIPSYRDLFPMPEEASVSGQLGDVEWAASVPVEALPAPRSPVDPLASRRGSDLAGGLTDFPCAQRATYLHSSVILQLDGLLHAVLRLRIERDVMAHSLQSSFTDVFGLAAFESCSSFCGLFFHDAEHVPDMVRAAKLHRAYGLFVVPFRIQPGTA